MLSFAPLNEFRIMTSEELQADEKSEKEKLAKMTGSSAAIIVGSPSFTDLIDRSVVEDLPRAIYAIKQKFSKQTENEQK